VTAEALGMMLFGWSYAVAATSLYGAGRAAWSRLRSVPARADRGLRVLVVRPCAGLEPSLDRTLASLSGIRTGATIACRFAVESAGDPAAAAASRAAGALRAAGMDAGVVFTGADAPNHKAAQIEAVLAKEPDRFEVLVVADSDVDLAAFELDTLLSPLLEDATVGAVWAPPIEAGAISGSGDRASRALLAGSLHAFTILGALDGGGLVGKLFAVRSTAVVAAGGFGKMRRVLGEDMELSRRLRGAGLSVRVAPTVARSLQTGRSWQDAAARYGRWLSVIRAQRPHLLASYPLLFCATPLIVIASLILLRFAPVLALAALVLGLASRLFTAAVARAFAGEPFSPWASLLDAVLADALLAHAFARAVATRRFVWRGRTLTIDRRGALSQESA
jgi:ceramide glucosyltransferase